MEACGSAHHWARELRKLGHDVRLMPAAYVKPYVKRGKTDAADAEAIYEAVRRPTMRFVEIKSEDQQAVLAIHRALVLSSGAGAAARVSIGFPVLFGIVLDSTLGLLMIPVLYAVFQSLSERLAKIGLR
ncbi:Transposase [Ruegeria meonggei]|uniref:Transposase n=1 Tax=Ruegeria meonggei TaxID=1446476 RepID=A0A1X7ACC4_9RHOB|nr:Transposase [Ruegeria meonggei]